MRSSTQLVSGGFYVARQMLRPESLGRTLLAERLTTLSSCLTDLLPGFASVEWVSATHEERLANARTFGIPEERLAAFIRFATDQMADGELGWHSVWRSLLCATAAKQTWALREDFEVLELGVPYQFVERLCLALAPAPGHGECGIYTQLMAKRPVDPGGTTLGWEPLGVEVDGSFHSWLCNSLHNDLFRSRSIRPNVYGLLANAEDAQAVLDLIDGGVGAEPVPWFFGAIRRFDHGSARQEAHDEA